MRVLFALVNLSGNGAHTYFGFGLVRVGVFFWIFFGNGKRATS